MSSLIRYAWLSAVLVLALGFFASNCGDESEVIIEEMDCQLDGFEGGSYLFTVNDIRDSENCSMGLADGYIGQTFGPAVLPATDQLPSDPTDINNVPLVGTVPVVFSTNGQAIQVAGTDQIQASYPGIGTITATVSGILCPASASRVDGQITVRVTSPITCNVTAVATGWLQ